jgi:hypothetical protein
VVQVLSRKISPNKKRGKGDYTGNNFTEKSPGNDPEWQVLERKLNTTYSGQRAIGYI